MSKGGAEKEGDRGSEVGSVLTVQSPIWGSKLMNYKIMTRAEVGHLTN